MNSIWNAIQSFEFSEELPLSQSWVPFVSAVVYIPSMLLLSRWARSRTLAIPTHALSVIYNAFMVALSLITWIGAIVSIILRGVNEGTVAILCEKTPNVMIGLAGVTCYTYYLTKYLEVMDTFFLAFRKKPLSWLHLYHHSLMFIVVWLWQKANLVGLLWLISENALIHVLMYSYYLCCDFGYHPWWKKYLTFAQIAQLSLGFIWMATWAYLRPRYNCLGGPSEMAFSVVANLVLISFFCNFYSKSYSPNNPKAASAKSD